MKINDKVWLGGKNARAAGKVSSVGASHWHLTEIKKEVGFSEKEGPWLMLIPVKNNQWLEEHKIWVNLNNDSNYVVLSSMSEDSN
jgi:hypothetical protein